MKRFEVTDAQPDVGDSPWAIAFCVFAIIMSCIIVFSVFAGMVLTW